MTDLGSYKTANAKTYRCHFNPDNKAAFAMGPLPEMKRSFEVEAGSADEAKTKLSGEIGEGIFC